MLELSNPILVDVAVFAGFYTVLSGSVSQAVGAFGFEACVCLAASQQAWAS
jgi:hypothetical protein